MPMSSEVPESQEQKLIKHNEVNKNLQANIFYWLIENITQPQW